MNHGSDCSCVLHSNGTFQTLQELDFSRGIWSAAIDGEEERVKKMLVEGTDVNSQDSSGYSALHYASRHGNYKICDVLIQAGAKVNSQTQGGTTPLHRATYSGHLNIVNLLLHHGADPSIVDSDGMTSLHKAAEGGNPEIIKVIISKLPSLKQAKDNRGRLPKDIVQEKSDKLFDLLK